MFDFTQTGRIPHHRRTPAFCDAIIAHRAPELSEVTYETSGDPVTVRGWAPPEDPSAHRNRMAKQPDRRAHAMGPSNMTASPTRLRFGKPHGGTPHPAGASSCTGRRALSDRAVNLP